MTKLPPGLSHDDHAAFLSACEHAEAEHRAFSNERELWRQCPLASCRRARTCHDAARRTCLRHAAALSGSDDILRAMLLRMADSGSALLPWREMAER